MNKKPTKPKKPKMRTWYVFCVVNSACFYPVRNVLAYESRPNAIANRATYKGSLWHKVGPIVPTQVPEAES